MSVFRYIVNFIQTSHNYEMKRGLLAKMFYLTPAERIQRLDEVFDTTQFSEEALSLVSDNGSAHPEAQKEQR
ncbi:TPA: hypothetical protein P0E37_001927 [Vibrio campbellii]|uniref:hypothetical protein n=1 Tax=Vibrio campbellii TaxID=680 RepID=UPI0006819BF9|nr:hypothetical protein [Vibrio campbellii]HDM8227469.1 hypothetical protein [Vibrio campbellii]